MHIRSNSGKLSLTRRKSEFSKLSEDEVIGMEKIVNSVFEGFDSE